MFNMANWVETKTAWGLLALTAIGLEITALIFQYAINLQPCVMCIYQRTAVLGIALAGVVGYFTCFNVFGRILAYALWGISVVKGFIIAQEHVAMQSEKFSFFFSCESVPNFPSWAPLHEWLPHFFKATGSCDNINWQFLGYSMPQWMMVVFGIYGAAFAMVLVNRLATRKMF